MTTWVLTASVANHEATAARDFSVIGLKQRNRARAEQIVEGDRFVLYLTKVMAFAGSIRVTGPLYEDREKVWPGKPGNPDAYPWRFATEPEVVLGEEDWVPASELVGVLDHIGKWPREHWKLAFQGQLRPVGEHDARVLLERMGAGDRVAP